MTDLTDKPDLTRRRLFARLGLAAGTAYVAPVMLHLSPAHASGASRPSGPSRASRPSAPSRPSRPSLPSRPSQSARGSYPSRPGSTDEMPLWMLQLLGLI